MLTTSGMVARGARAGTLELVREVPIQGEMIRLGQLLKLAEVVDTGAEVKRFLATEPVCVNGQREARRGRQLCVGDVVQIHGRELRVTGS